VRSWQGTKRSLSRRKGGPGGGGGDDLLLLALSFGGDMIFRYKFLEAVESRKFLWGSDLYHKLIECA
jgi:hypothetical protein